MSFSRNFVSRLGRSLFPQCYKNLKCASGFQTSRILEKENLSQPYGADEKRNYGHPLPELPPLDGIHDENFTKYFAAILRQPSLLYESGRNFAEEFKQFVDTKKEEYNSNFIIRGDPRNHVNMLFTFEKEEDIHKFLVTADSTDNIGHSTASLALTQDKTALFSGYLNTEPIKSGRAKVAGFATMRSPRKKIGLRMKSYYNWYHYSHLVFKVRGDGRSYLIILPVPMKYDEAQGLMYAHPLFTRGGPYWQIAKIPFSHFFLLNEGRMIDGQNSPVVLNQIGCLGITAAGYDGHFKLEIDYIGLEYDPHHNNKSPYEEYYHIKAPKKTRLY